MTLKKNSFLVLHMCTKSRINQGFFCQESFFLPEKSVIYMLVFFFFSSVNSLCGSVATDSDKKNYQEETEKKTNYNIILIVL